MFFFKKKCHGEVGFLNTKQTHIEKIVIITKINFKSSLPTETAFCADSVRAASTMSLRWITLEPRLTALQVITTFGLQSMILWARDSEENPAKTT